MFAEVVVNVPAISGTFDYRVPEELAAQASMGQLVTVPFGRQTVQGVIIRFMDAASVRETKSIINILDPLPVLTHAQIMLAQEMAQANLASLAAMVGLMLPPGLSQQGDVLYSVNREQGSMVSDQSSVIQRRIVDLLIERGPLRGRQIDSHIKKVEWRNAAQYLVKKGVLASQSVLPTPRVRPKFARLAQLAVAPDIAEAAMSDLGKTEATRKRREAALRFLLRVKDAVNVSWVYAESGCSLADLQELEDRELIRSAR